MELRTYGLRGFGFLVFWLSVVCVYVVCVGVAFCMFEVLFVVCIVYLGIWGSWVFGFLGFCLMLYVRKLCLAFCVLGFCVLDLGGLGFGFCGLVSVVFCLLFCCISEPCVLNLVHFY